MKPVVLSFILICFITLTSKGQNDTLPKFSAIAKDGKITISWINRFTNAHQITIQRSKDSLKNFFTIFSLPDPTVTKFSFKDEKAPNDSLYYRIFILIGGTNYFFSTSKKPFRDTTKPVPVVKKTDAKNDGNKKKEEALKIETNDNSNDKKEKEVKEEPPSPPKKYVWEPSVYIFTADDGNVSIVIPGYKTKKYHIKFFEENDTPIFELHEVKESPLLLDKVNFLHSGWFKFELYENGVLLEKNKFLITRDN
ncbi:MAG: hypothetical protein HYX40_08430 [Sphingobacteriales bacterium]|nr:hypothetical protein [Sphingobacteriales bacterium]